MAGQPRIAFIVPDAETQRKQDVVSALLACGALDIRNGSFTAHFDSDGNLGVVERSDRIFRRGTVKT